MLPHRSGPPLPCSTPLVPTAHMLPRCRGTPYPQDWLQKNAIVLPVAFMG